VKECFSAEDPGCIGGLPQLIQQITAETVEDKTMLFSTGNFVGGQNGWLSVIQGGDGWKAYGDLLQVYFSKMTAMVWKNYRIHNNYKIHKLHETTLNTSTKTR